MAHRGSFDAASHRPFRWHSYPKGVGMTRLDNPDVVWWSDAGALTGIELPNLAAASSGHQGVTLGNPTFFAADSVGERCAIQLDGTNDSISIGASPYTEGYFDFRASEGHLITIPYHASFNVPNDITILVKLTAGDWTPGGIQTLASRWLPGTNYCWLFRLNGAGHLMYNWSLDGQTTFQVQSSASVVPPTDGSVWVAVAHDVNTGTGNVVRFFTSTSFAEPTSMTLLSAHTDPSTTTGIYASTSAPIRIGSRDSNQERLYGRYKTLIVRGSVNGTNIGLTNEVVRIDADIVVNEADLTIPMPVPSGHVATVDGDILRRPVGGGACFGPGESGTIILCGMIEPTHPAGARLFDSQPASMMGGQAIHITGTSGTAVTARTARAGLGTETTVAETASTAMPEVICLRIDRAAGLLKLWTNSGGETTTALDPAQGSSQRFTDIRIGSSNENSQYANFDFYSGAILRGAITDDDRDAIADLFLNGSDTYDDSDTWTATTPGIFDGTFYNAGDQVLALNPNNETVQGYLTPSISGASTPDAPGLDITGNVRLTAKIRKNDLLSPGAFRTFSAQLTWPPNYSWRWSFFPDSNIVFGASPNGSDFLDNEVLSAAEVAANFQANEDFCIGLSINYDTDIMQSLTSDDEGRTWYPIGAPRAALPFVPFNSNSPLEIGTQHGGGQHIFDGRIYWVQMESTEGGRYFTPTLGDVSTPDPGPLPPEFTLVYKVRGVATGPYWQSIALQWPQIANQWAWRADWAWDAWEGFFSSANGTNNDPASLYTVGANREGEHLAAQSVQLNDAGQRRLKLWEHNGTSWVGGNVASQAATGIFDSIGPLSIGAGSVSSLSWNGRIYSVELRTGLNPTGSDALWVPGYMTFPTTTGANCAIVNDVGALPVDSSGSMRIECDRPASDGHTHAPIGPSYFLLYLPYSDGSNYFYFYDTTGAPIGTYVGAAEMTAAGVPATGRWQFKVAWNAVTDTASLHGRDPALGRDLMDETGWTLIAQRVHAGYQLRNDSSYALLQSFDPGWRGSGKIWRAVMEINGAVKVDFDFRYLTANPGASITLPTGQTCNINKGGMPQLVGTPMQHGLVWKFDAAEAPTDVATTTWNDPRGRTWTATNPQAISGRSQWRFDANDYPGTGTSYVDPRGRTWSTTNAAAITPLVPGLDESIPFDDVDWARVPFYATTFAAAPPAMTHFGLVEMNGPPTPHEASFFEDAVIYPYRRLDIHNYDGSLWMENAPLISGSVNIDYGRDERRSGDCEIWLPETAIGPGGLWYDKIFKFYRGLTLGPRYREPNYRGATLVWQIGSFVADRISESSESANFNVTFRDQSKRMMLSKLVEATTFPEGTEIATVVRAVAANSGVFDMLVPATGKQIGKDFTFEAGTSRWEIAKKVATDFGYELFFDHRGWLVMRPFTDPLTSPIYLYLVAKRAGLGANGQKSNVGSYDRSASDERIYNHIVVTAEGTDRATVYRAEAENTLPNSPTSIARIGRRTLNYNSSFITSPQQCQETADALLAINALEQFTINVGTIVYPWIEVGTTIHFDEDKTEDNYPSRYLLLSATIPLGLEAMSLAGSRVTIIGKADPS